MNPHDLWHLVVLASTLFGTAGLALIALAPLLFERPPPGFRAARRIVLLLVFAAALLLAAEWRLAH